MAAATTQSCVAAEAVSAGGGLHDSCRGQRRLAGMAHIRK